MTNSMWSPAHLNGNRSVIAGRSFGYATVTYEAFEVRRERGVHAKVYVKVNGVTASWSRINVESSEDRVRLAGKAHAQFGKSLGDEWPKKYVEKDLDDFCDVLYDTWMAQFAPGLMAGMEERVATAMLVEDLIPEKGGAMIVAPPGRGKSYIAMLLQTSVQYGNNQLFRIPKAANSLYVNLERSRESMRQRLGNVNDVLGMDRGTEAHFLNARGRGLADVYDSVERYVHDNAIEFVVLDSISRAGYSGSLTEDVTSNRITDALNGLGVTWIGLGHTPRADDTHEYGSIMFRAGVDVMIILNSQQKDDGTMGIGLRVDKGNDLGKVPQIIIGLAFDDKGLTRAWRASAKEFPEVAAGKPTSMPDAIDDYLGMVGWASPSVISTETGYNRTNISTYLNAAPDRYNKRSVAHKVEYSRRAYA